MHRVPQFQFSSPEHLIAPAELTVHGVPELVARVRHAHRDAACVSLVLDLSHVLSMDPRVVGALFWADRFTRCHGGRLRIVPPPSGVLCPRAALALERLHGPTDGAERFGALPAA